MKKVDKIPFFELIIFSVIFCLNYRKDHNGLKEKLNVHDVRECMQKLTGNDVNYQDIEKVTKTLITKGLIDENLIIQDETIENSLIQFNVKQNRSDTILNHYADRKRLIISVLKVLAYQKGNVSGLTIKEIQNELKKVSGVTVKQEEIKTVMDSRFEEIVLLGKYEDFDEEQQRIRNLVNLENVAEIGIWSLVTFGIICCVRRTSEYSEKKKILEENTVLRKIEELVDCSVESLYGFTFKDIKDELILNKLINSTLNITVKDISRGEIIINRRPLVGPIFANLDFISFLAFYVLYSLERKPSNNYEIAEHIKRIVKEYSFDLFYHIDRKNIAFIIGFLYAQGLIDEKLKITVPDLRRFRFFINDIKELEPDKIKIKELIIQDCLKKMGCDEGNGVDFGGEIRLHESMADETVVKEHYPFKKPSFAKLDFVSFLAFYALYIKGRAPFKRDEILNKMKSVAKEHSFELTGIDKNASPLIFNYLYAQGIINNKKDVIVPDLGHFLFCINDMNMIESEKTSPKVVDDIRKKNGIIQRCLTKMGCDYGIIDAPEADSGACSHYEDQTYYNDAGQIFHRFNSDELENHEWIFIDCLQNRDYLKKIVGEKGRPLALKFQDGDRVFNEFKSGQEFLWECYDARTNKTRKNYYRRLSFFVSKFIYENSLFLKGKEKEDPPAARGYYKEDTGCSHAAGCKTPADDPAANLYRSPGRRDAGPAVEGHRL